MQCCGGHKIGHNPYAVYGGKLKYVKENIAVTWQLLWENWKYQKHE